MRVAPRAALASASDQAGATLPRRARLTDPRQFEQALRSRRRQEGRYFSLQATDNGGSASRLGMIVSRRVAPRAVDRNLTKRVVREAFRARRHGLGAQDVVVRSRRLITRDTAADARAELDALLRLLVP